MWVIERYHGSKKVMAFLCGMLVIRGEDPSCVLLVLPSSG